MRFLSKSYLINGNWLVNELEVKRIVNELVKESTFNNFISFIDTDGVEHGAFRFNFYVDEVYDAPTK
jgi:hypothetical protein